MAFLNLKCLILLLFAIETRRLDFFSSILLSRPQRIKEHTTKIEICLSSLCCAHCDTQPTNESMPSIEQTGFPSSAQFSPHPPPQLTLPKHTTQLLAMMMTAIFGLRDCMCYFSNCRLPHLTYIFLLSSEHDYRHSSTGYATHYPNATWPALIRNLLEGIHHQRGTYEKFSEQSGTLSL